MSNRFCKISCNKTQWTCCGAMHRKKSREEKTRYKTMYEGIAGVVALSDGWAVSMRGERGNVSSKLTRHLACVRLIKVLAPPSGLFWLYLSCQSGITVQSQKGGSAYSTSKQILPLGFAGECWLLAEQQQPLSLFNLWELQSAGAGWLCGVI